MQFWNTRAKTFRSQMTILLTLVVMPALTQSCTSNSTVSYPPQSDKYKYGPGVCHLGKMYLNGFACSKDDKRAKDLFVQSSALGCDEGTFELARIYQNGHGCAKDSSKAMALYDQLCTEHSPRGLYGKAELFWDGSDVSYEDAHETINLLEHAANAGLPEAAQRLAEIYYYGEKIPTNKEVAFSWAQRGVEQGDISCQLLVAEMNMRGEGKRAACQDGLKQLKALADQSIVEAEDQLGHAYEEGLCVKKDHVAAEKWLEKASARNYLPALIELAGMHLYVGDAQKKLEQAFEINMKRSGLEGATTAQRAEGQFHAGCDYEEGWHVEKNLEQARIWYEKAVSCGSPHACNNLAHMYIDGAGVSANNALGAYSHESSRAFAFQCSLLIA